MKNVILDTNILMNGVDLSQFEKVYLPIVVLEELDKHKYSDNSEKAYKARKAIHNIKNEHNIDYKLSFSYSLPQWLDLNSPDNRILGFACDITTYDRDAVLLTMDLNMIEKAKALNIPVQEWNDDIKQDDYYKGYKQLSGDTEFINQLFNDIENGINTYNFVVNEFLILHNTDLDEILEYRFDGEKFVSLKLPSSKIIKGLNPLQRCALDLLNNKDIGIVAVCGEVGSGKTFSCMRMALHHVTEKGNQSKVLVIREPDGEGKSIGFLKGTYEDKTKAFFMPIVHSLSGGEFELNALIQRGVFESNIPYFLKGTTYNDTIVIVDEAEDLTEKQLRLIGTRVGENSRIFFSGDYKQAIRNNNVYNNPLVKMCNELKGNPMFGCIYLDEDVRSSISKTFAYLFQK